MKRPIISLGLALFTSIVVGQIVNSSNISAEHIQGFPVTSALLQRSSSMPMENSGARPSSDSMKSNDQTHMDRKPEHGGNFCMGLDNQPYLEGVLLPPGVFVVYFYDDHTKSLKVERMKNVSGSIQLGDSDSMPKLDPVSGKKKEPMQANLADALKLPVKPTRLVHFLGMAADARPEIFNFSLDNFTYEHGPGTAVPTGYMNM